jgi:hypothetical protein
MFNAQHHIEELYQTALGVGSSRILSPFCVLAAVIVQNPMREASIFHVLASGKEGANSVIKDMGVTALIHPYEQAPKLIQRFGEFA